MSKIMMNKRYGLEAATIEGYKTKTSRIEKCLSALPTDYNKMNTQIEIYPYDTATETIVAKRIWLGCRVETYHLKPRYKVGEVVALAQSYKDVYDTIEQHDGKWKANEWWLKAYDHVGEGLGPAVTPGWNNKMFVRQDLMPHHILIDNVELRRLWDFSNEDCIDEGIKGSQLNTYPHTMYFPYPGCKDSEVCHSPMEAFKILFDKLNGHGAHDKNPWLFVYSFVKITTTY